MIRSKEHITILLPMVLEIVILQMALQQRIITMSYMVTLRVRLQKHPSQMMISVDSLEISITH